MAKKKEKPFDPSKSLENPKEEKAVQLYLETENQSEAYRKAFKSKAKSIHQLASRLFRNDKVKARLAFLTEKHLSHLDITTERILKEQARLAFSDPKQMYDEDGKLLPIHEMPEDIRRCIAGVDVTESGSGKFKSVTTKPRLISKDKALDSLMRHKGLFEKDNEQKNKGVEAYLAYLKGEDG